MTNKTKRQIALTAWVVCVCAVVGTCTYDCFRSGPIIAGHDRKFSACMAESAPTTLHWKAAQSCFKRVPYSRRGQGVMQGYGLPSAMPRGRVPTL